MITDLSAVEASEAFEGMIRRLSSQTPRIMIVEFQHICFLSADDRVVVSLSHRIAPIVAVSVRSEILVFISGAEREEVPPPFIAIVRNAVHDSALQS